MKPHLIVSELSDRLEGLDSRFALLTRQIDTLKDEVAIYDRPPDPSKLANSEILRRKVKPRSWGCWRVCFASWGEAFRDFLMQLTGRRAAQVSLRPPVTKLSRSSWNVAAQKRIIAPAR